MPRIAGINIPDQKQIEFSLAYIYGIGRSLSRKILKEVGIDATKKTSQLTSEEIAALRDVVEKKFKIEGELERQVSGDIKRLKDIKCWRGLRHIKGLPVRGQTTRVNNRTVRGNVRRTVGSGRKRAPTPT